MGVSNQKTLYLLRHAIALNDMADGDKGRALAPKGKEDAVALGKLMKHKAYIPDVILCSSARRTKETLEAVQQSLNIENVEHLDILYAGSTGDYLHTIQKVDDANSSILMVAHNPSIYDLTRLLGGQGTDSVMQRLTEGYQPATLSIIKCTCEKWADIQPVENELVLVTDPMDYNAPARPTRWM